MSKWEKLVARILSLSNDLRFEELEKLLVSYGYEMKGTRNGSSHYSFRKKGKRTITIPKHTPIKKKYVEMVKTVIMEEEHEKN